MELVAQDLDDILGSLSPIDVAWEDETSARAVMMLHNVPTKAEYDRSDIQQILDANFNDGILLCRLFLGYSKDKFTAELRSTIAGEGTGITRYRREPEVVLDALLEMGVAEAMTREVNRKLTWRDILIERLRFGRGSAISGMRRGRTVENFVESIISEVVGESYDTRCNFTGIQQRMAKCDFAIPDRNAPRIIIEAKGYGATGSKQTDILGDIEKIINALRRDQHFIFFTDGLTWAARQSDLRKIVEHQNEGNILRIYTYQMADQFSADLQQLKLEQGL